MGYCLNRVQLIGNVGKDPEFRKTGKGADVAVFSLATVESWKDKATGEYNAKTEWHDICVYNTGLMDIIRTAVKKGSKLYIEGNLSYNKKRDENSGLTRTFANIVLNNYGCQLILLNSKKRTYIDESKHIDEYNDANEEIRGKLQEGASIDDEIPF